MEKTLKKRINRIKNIIHGNPLAQELSEADTAKSDINEKIALLCRSAAAQGAVLLKNNGALPLDNEQTTALFGRCAWDYFCVGYGSGGDVVAPYKVNLADALKISGTCIDDEMSDIYSKWRLKKKNKPKDGVWGRWPFAYKEMPLERNVVKNVAKRCTTAVVVIGRAAGEDRENKMEKGSYYLTENEENMLSVVSSEFKKVVVVLDIGNIIDMSWIEKYNIDSVLLAWQGGMESGNAVADILTGALCPSGRLADTVFKSYKDWPSSDNFGKKHFNNYAEDIFVGYRYSETFAKDSVLYPFGFGLSYTSFEKKCVDTSFDGDTLKIKVNVKNVGKYPGRETIMLFVNAPQGKLGKANRVLCAFKKTGVISVSESCDEILSVSIDSIASFDDSGVTGNKSAWVLEKGKYSFLLGSDVRNCADVFSFEITDLKVVNKLSEAMAVKYENKFERIVNENGIKKYSVPAETTNLKEKILLNLPQSIPITGDKGYKLNDVADGKITMDDFVAQLSHDELEAISRGEGGMRTELGASGNAGAFGGISETLRKKGIPPVITTDGPAGIRLTATCSLLPCGTLLACTWDEDLVRELYHEVADEMLERGSDVLLAPGMNIHRNPLCGRNFEYFSEDPFVSGKMAAAVVRGLQHDGISACPKHFACNNQESNRNKNDSRVSERALREIYLKGFEICVKEAKPMNIMTSYNKINGVWSHYNYELVTTVLRKEWKYEGNVVTDWWMRDATSPEFPILKRNAYRVRAGVDVLMPGGKNFFDKKGKNDGTLLSSFGKDNGITDGEMQITAKHVLNMVIKSSAMKRNK